MTSENIHVRVPGKLFIAGEYAVLEPYQPSVVIAVDRYVTAQIACNPQNSLALPGFGVDQALWRYADGAVIFVRDDARFRFVGSAMAIALRYLHEHGIRPDTFCLTISSELDDPSGRKYGLGSSAAVVVAVVTAILSFHRQAKPAMSELLFKLSAIAHLLAQGSGSGADVAAAVFGGWLRYTSFQADWLLRRIRQNNLLATILDEPWPFLNVERLAPFPHLRLCVGWTGEPASTAGLIQPVQRLRDAHPEAYQQFLQESAQAVRELLAGFAKGDVALVLAGISRNREALDKLGKFAETPVVTPELAELCRIADSCGGAGKPSGAGGGDCGIAFIPGETQMGKLYAAWRQAGIMPLSLNVAQSGAAIINQSHQGMKMG